MKKQKFNIPKAFYSILSDSSRVTADSGVSLISNNTKFFEQLYFISFSSPYPYCMRAARIIQLYCEKDASFIKPLINEVIQLISSCKVSGVKRSYLKVLNETIDLRTLEDSGLLVKICFDWLMSMKEDTAVRIYCMDILYKITAIEPDLKPELISSIAFYFNNSSVGFRNKAKKILQKLGGKGLLEYGQ